MRHVCVGWAQISREKALPDELIREGSTLPDDELGLRDGADGRERGRPHWLSFGGTEGGGEAMLK